VVARNMKNVLETVTAKRFPVINSIKANLLELGASGSIMSGSGPTVFGIFSKMSLASYAYEIIKNKDWRCWLTTTVQGGI
jgi:4-diphosphocytidyl-2-C-methyl-D-erythritol kinase